MRYQNFLISTMATLVVGVLVPFLLDRTMAVMVRQILPSTAGTVVTGFSAIGLQLLNWLHDLLATTPLFISVGQVILAGLLGKLLCRKLTGRTFVFQRGDG